MCGIFGYKGDNNKAGEIVLEGLKRLDYRGYDSWGITTASNNILNIEKEIGKISEAKNLKPFPNSTSAIAHTRWATTGAVTKINAHPHKSTDGSFVLAQNGIVENFEKLKQSLIRKKYKFYSETDTEVIVRLIEESSTKNSDFLKAVRQAFLKLEGRNTIIILKDNGDIYAARNGSPLVIGVNTKKNEVFLSSDTLSFAPFVDKILVVENNQMITICENREVNLYDIKSGKKLKYTYEPITIKADKIDKEGYDHFMLKEINETPYVIKQIINQDKNKLEELSKAIKKAKHVYTIGSGTAGFAATQIAFYLKYFGKINAVSIVGADSRSYYNIFQEGDLIIAPSQSGETADVIEVLEYVKEKGLKIASIVNMPGSMITRMSDYPFMCNAGPEICVMSTKVFTSQIAWGYLVAKTVQGKYLEGKKNLQLLSKEIDTYLKKQNNLDLIKSIAKKLSKKEHIFLLGKYQNFAIINEGMVKIIESTYKHAHAIPAGDLKHYAITLMEKGVPVIVVVSNDIIKNDIEMAINEVRLRGAEVYAIAHKNQTNFDYFLPVVNTFETDAIGNILPIQLLSYYMALELGNNIDKPRNIAKSVTVK
jgi:glucosamine--fructose-6-phosphate aminotransferase (isomerizing)